MRNLKLLGHLRDRAWELRFSGQYGDSQAGAFKIPSPTDGGELRVLASAGEGWDHVSVSRASRCPNWPEMEKIKRLFFEDHEVAMQLHVAVADHITHHPYMLHIWRPHYTLHIWRPHFAKIPLPPDWMVGPKVATEPVT